MTRFSLLFALALGLGACDAGAPSSAADASSAPMAHAKSDAVHRITESISVFVDGDRVLLDIEGHTVDLGAGEAYLVGQTLARVGYETLSPEMAEVFPRGPRGGDKCEPPPSGAAVLSVGGSIFAGGGGGCPPPPPPFALQRIDVLSQLLKGVPAEVVEAPEGTEWERIPGGFTAPF